MKLPLVRCQLKVPGHHLYFWPTSNKEGILTTLSSGSVTCCKGSKYSEKYIYLFVTKDITDPYRWTNLENSAVATGLEQGNAEEFHTLALTSHASKVMLKILQARLQQYMNREPPDVQAGFRKGIGTRSNCLDHRKSKRITEKHLLLLHWLCQSLWLCGSQQIVENS